MLFSKTCKTCYIFLDENNQDFSMDKNSMNKNKLLLSSKGMNNYSQVLKIYILDLDFGLEIQLIIF